MDLHGAVLYHCGPVMLKDRGRLADEGRRPDHQHPRGALPGATSSATFGVRAVIGKGGMGAKTLQALKEHGGGLPATPSAARRSTTRAAIEKVQGVSLAGVRHPGGDVAPARSKDFPAIVTMDAHGNSLHKDIETESARRLAVMD